MQSRVTSVTDVELLTKIGLDETDAITLERWQIGVLYESDKAFLSEFMLASLSGRLGDRLGTIRRTVSLVQFRRRTEEVSGRCGRLLRDRLFRVVLLCAV